MICPWTRNDAPHPTWLVVSVIVIDLKGEEKEEEHIVEPPKCMSQSVNEGSTI